MMISKPLQKRTRPIHKLDRLVLPESTTDPAKWSPIQYLPLQELNVQQFALHATTIVVYYQWICLREIARNLHSTINGLL